MAGLLRIRRTADTAYFGAYQQQWNRSKCLVPLRRIKWWINHWPDRAILGSKQILHSTHHTIYWCNWQLGTVWTKCINKVTRTECKYMFGTKDVNGNLFWVFFRIWVRKRLKEWVSCYRLSVMKVASLYWWQILLTKNLMTFAQAWITAFFNGN
jgi:hypothetical protein